MVTKLWTNEKSPSRVEVSQRYSGWSRGTWIRSGVLLSMSVISGCRQSLGFVFCASWSSVLNCAAVVVKRKGWLTAWVYWFVANIQTHIFTQPNRLVMNACNNGVSPTNQLISCTQTAKTQNLHYTTGEIKVSYSVHQWELPSDITGLHCNVTCPKAALPSGAHYSFIHSPGFCQLVYSSASRALF